jgi:phospholipase/carboxylesterase
MDAIEISTGDDVELAIVWLHGLGADGHDFEPIVAELDLPFGVRFVFPHAPVRPVTINGGLPMRAWYDIVTLDGRFEDAAGLRESAAAVTELVDRECRRDLTADAVVVAGFSQGGAVALHTALRETRPLAGVIALSTYLPLAATLTAERSAANRATPIFMGHGDVDAVIAIEHASRSRDLLRAAGYDVDWRTYPMGHAVCAPEIRDIASWLTGLAER